jgi:hypothetical protein
MIDLSAAFCITFIAFYRCSFSIEAPSNRKAALGSMLVPENRRSRVDLFAAPQRLFGRKPNLKHSLDNNGAQLRFFAPRYPPRGHGARHKQTFGASFDHGAASAGSFR